LGHNHASDIWALGVIIYEILMAVTPFAPKRPDNVTELFTNIAMVKVSHIESRWFLLLLLLDRFMNQ
jgi:serine/threonine protein kinase